MKFLVIVFLALGAGAVGLMHNSIMRPARGRALITVTDLTDHMARPTRGDFDRFILDTDYRYAPLWIKTTSVSEVSFNAGYVDSVAGTSRFFSNPRIRRSELCRLDSAVYAHEVAIGGSQSSRPHSSIYLALVGELRELAARPEPIKELDVYSDAGENSGLFSAYRSDGLRLAETHPEVVAARLCSAQSPGALAGIVIRFIYKPETEAGDRRFRVMERVFARAFEGCGATVVASAPSMP